MELQLDSKNRHRVKYCPCNKSNKDGKFVPFVDFMKHGYCHSCDKTIFPDTNYFPDFSRIEKKKANPKYIEKDYLKSLLYNHKEDNNNFVYFLDSKLGVYPTHNILKDYLLGTSKRNDAAVVFPYIDAYNNIISLKVMQYEKQTGKRKGIIYYNSPEERYPICFFGEHLISQYDKPIGIVESEKTACLMSYFIPYYTWLACGGSNGLKANKFDAFKYRTVHLFPDEGKFIEWSKKLIELEDLNPLVKFDISKECELWHQENLISKGDDIADYYLKLLSISE
tara:strand:- start:19 stop:861 length:843 start_codon:yes stop_codon:yes gene_type:complete